MSGVTHCKGCGKQIVYVKMPTGADMPVDLGLQVVEIDMDVHSNFIGKVANTNPNLGIAYGLNHFMNCPKARDFSKGGNTKTETADHKAEASGESHP